MIKIGFDIGGVLSKYPDTFKTIISALQKSPDIEVHVLSDITPHSKCVEFVHLNGFCDIQQEHIHSCDYSVHQELCKSVVSKEIGLDVLIDDYVAYLAEGAPIRLLVMPDPHTPYNHKNWKLP